METGTIGTIKWTVNNGLMVFEPIKNNEGSCHSAPNLSSIAESVIHIKTKGLLHFSGHALSGMFRGFVNLETADLSGFETSQATTMAGMFFTCKNLKQLNLSSFDTSNIDNMQSMFFNCGNLISLDLSSFDASNVTNTISMFDDCKNLITLNLSNFHTSKLANASYMFNGCSSLTSLDLSSFFTGWVENMSDMFNECSSLTSLDLSNFNTVNVYNMKRMFFKCQSLTSLDISNFNFENVEKAENIFFLCENLTDLSFPDYIKEKAEKLTVFITFNNLLPSYNIKQNIKSANKIFEILEKTNGLKFTKEREQLKVFSSYTKILFDGWVVAVAEILARKNCKKLSDILTILVNQQPIENIENRSIDDIVSALKNNGTASNINAYLNGVPLEDILA